MILIITDHLDALSFMLLLSALQRNTSCFLSLAKKTSLKQERSVYPCLFFSKEVHYFQWFLGRGGPQTPHTCPSASEWTTVSMFPVDLTPRFEEGPRAGLTPELAQRGPDPVNVSLLV